MIVFADVMNYVSLFFNDKPVHSEYKPNLIDILFFFITGFNLLVFSLGFVSIFLSEIVLDFSFYILCF